MNPSSSSLYLHTKETAGLAVPAGITRIGVVGLGVVDTAMVGHFATKDLAWLNLANQTFVMFLLVVGMGMMAGTTVLTANAYGRKDYAACGQVWRRTLPYAALLGIITLLTSLTATSILSLLGQTPENSQQAGKLILIQGVGIPGHLLFMACTMFLEGCKRPQAGVVMMLGANLLNVALNYLLIYGNWGLPELGAEGSAWASTLVRWSLAVGAIIYVLRAPSLKQFKTRVSMPFNWSDGKKQRSIGYAVGLSLAAEVGAFNILTLFAGWLGTLYIAGFGVAVQIMSVPMMISVGIAVATMVRTGIAFSEKDTTNIRNAIVSGLLVNLLVITVFVLLMFTGATTVFGAFTDDAHVITLMLPLTGLIVLNALFDSSQGVLSRALRGIQDTWIPSKIQIFCFVILMVPLGYFLGISLERGLNGLLEAMAIAAALSLSLLLIRFNFSLRSLQANLTETQP